MLGAVTEDDVIRCAQHLDFIYSQSGTLYDIIPQDPCPSNKTPQPTPRPHADGVIGSISISSSTVNQIVRKLGQLAIVDDPTSPTYTMTSTTSST